MKRTDADRDLNNLSPRMLAKWQQLAALLEQRGVHVIVTETRRTQERQNWLVAKKLSKVNRSRHQDGDAVDIMLDTKHHRDIAGPWDTTTPRGRELWFTYGEAAESLGLRWGGRFHKGGDLPKNQRNTIGWDAAHVEFREDTP